MIKAKLAFYRRRQNKLNKVGAESRLLPCRRETWIGSKFDFRLPSPRRKRLVLMFPTNIEATEPPRVASYISSFLHMLHDVDLKPSLEIVVFCDNLPFSGMPQNQALASLSGSIRR